MVTSIARQSVIIKCNMQKSILTGSYEYYYAAGLTAKLTGLSIPEDARPEEIQELLLAQLPGLSPRDEREKYLFSLVKAYCPGEEYDMQMKELFLWGKKEERLWLV